MCPTLPPLPARCPVCRVSQGLSRLGQSSRKLRPVSAACSRPVVVEVPVLAGIPFSSSRLIAIFVLSSLANGWLENNTAASTQVLSLCLVCVLFPPSLAMCVCVHKCVGMHLPRLFPNSSLPGSRVTALGHSAAALAWKSWMDPEGRLGPCLGYTSRHGQ